METRYELLKAKIDELQRKITNNKENTETMIQLEIAQVELKKLMIEKSKIFSIN